MPLHNNEKYENWTRDWLVFPNTVMCFIPLSIDEQFVKLKCMSNNLTHKFLVKKIALNNEENYSKY